MAIDSNRFVINKGTSNEFIIKIKQNGSTMPMEISGTDTFFVKFYNLETKELELSIDMTSGSDGQVSVYNAYNGQILIVLKNSAIADMVSERGDKVDKYYLKPTYRMVIDCDTVNNGKFTAKINSVYVQE